MIRILLIVLIIILISAGLIYFRFFSTKPDTTILTSGQVASTKEGPVEVPKTLPNATVEDRIKVLEDALVEIVKKVNSLGSEDQTEGTSTDSKLNSIEASITDLKTRVSSLEQATPVPVATSSKSTIFIPLGGGGSWSHSDWTSLAELEISLDPANFPDYTGMVLEVNSRMVESAATGTVRFYNVTDSSAISSEISTSSTTFAVRSSSSFKLPSGNKTYKLQVKISSGKNLVIDFARIRVNF